MAESAEVLFVAVKPQYVGAVLREVAPVLTDRHIVVSIAAGVTLQSLKASSALRGVGVGGRWGWVGVHGCRG